MQLLPHSPLPAVTLLWQPRADRWLFTVVCKATFLLRPGLSPFAPDPDPLRPADVPWGNDDRCSLFAAGDLVPFKRYPEVLVFGSAWAPAGYPVIDACVRLAVGSIDKRVEVLGDRFFTLSGELTAPLPFVRMPLSWERAAGGPDTLNPVGVRMGAGAVPDAWGRFPVPNLQPSGRVLAGVREVFPPVGLGPISPDWPSRVARLPALADPWESRRWSEHPLPAGFDPWFFNAAPEDQQLAVLRGDERLVLQHLHPEHPYLETVLERIEPRAAFAWTSGERTDVELRADTLAIEADRGRATLTWRGHVSLPSSRPPGEVVVTLDRLDPQASVRSRPLETETIDLGLFRREARSASPLPFTGAVFRAAADAPPSPPPPVPRPDTESEDLAATSTAPLHVASLRRPPLPFVQATEPASGDAAALLPPPLSSPFTLPGQEPATHSGPPSFEIPSSLAAVDVPAGNAIRAAESTRALPGSSGVPPRPAPAPPPLIGPLAPLLAPAPSAIEAPPPSTPPPVPAPPPPAPLPPAPLPLAEYPLERCAAISASLARRPDRAPDLMAEHRLDLATWRSLRGHWDEAIREETRRGRADLLRAHDAAFVTQIERERGPITPEQYARLAVAVERDRGDDALAELDLPRAAVLPIERVYLARAVEDPKHRMSVRAALVAMRRS